jgi:hypothetical protein
VLDTNDTDAAATPPNETDEEDVKPVPVIVIEVPPAVDPEAGLTPDTTGTAPYANWSAVTTTDWPLGAVTRTFAVPTACVGDTATIFESDLTAKLGAATPPNTTVVASVKPEPVIVTSVSPDVGPVFGDTNDTTGTTGADEYVNWSAETTAD